MNIEEKKTTVEELKGELSGKKGLWLTDFSGLDASTVTKLRRLLREHEMPYRVVKNSLLERALKNTDFEELTQYIAGPIGLCYADDIIIGSRMLNDFRQEVEKFTIKKAWLEGKVYEGSQIGEIARIPPREVLISSVLGVLKVSVVDLVSVLKGVIGQCVSGLDAICKKKGEQNV